MEVLKRSVFVECKVSKDKKLVEEELIGYFGSESYSSVVLADGGFFVTLNDMESVDAIVQFGMVLAGEECAVRKVGSREKLLTFLEVPEFVEDSAIEGKLVSLGCELKSPVIWDRTGGKYYGKRSVKIILPEGISSLPYSIRLKDVLGLENAYSIRHDHQLKVCNKCFSPSHLYKGCPEFLCRACGRQGHIARVCPNPSQSLEVGTRFEPALEDQAPPPDVPNVEPAIELPASAFPSLPTTVGAPSFDGKEPAAVSTHSSLKQTGSKSTPGQTEKRMASSSESGGVARTNPSRATLFTRLGKKPKTDSAPSTGKTNVMEVDDPADRNVSQ